MSILRSLISILNLSAVITIIELGFSFSMAPNAWAAASQAVVSFSTPVNRIQHQSTNVDYNIDPRRSKYLVYLPANYTPSQSFGLMVFISPTDNIASVPAGWEDVLERRKLLFVCPQNAGNKTPTRYRRGLALLGTLEMMRNYNVDKSRIYAAGFSGGARIAGDLAFTHNDLFRGTIQSCGTNFYRNVQRRYATSDSVTGTNHYGLFTASASEVAEARNKTRFVLITGSGDFRRGNIVDIYNGGFALEHFQSKLIDVPGMGHQNCDGKVLEQALDFLK